MKVGDTVCIVALDKQGQLLYFNDGFDTMKAARAWFKGVKSRGFWVHHCESETEPASIHTIRLMLNDEVISDYYPEFI